MKFKSLLCGVLSLLAISAQAQLFYTYDTAGNLSAAGYRPVTTGLALTRGYASKADGLGQFYEWVPGSTSSTNSSTIALRGDPPGRWKQISTLQVTMITDLLGTGLPIVNGGTGSTNVAAIKAAFGIKSGTATSADDGTVTNTFSTPFASVPVVVTTPYNGLTIATNTVSSVTSSNFVWQCGSPSIVVNWIAIGAP